MIQEFQALETGPRPDLARACWRGRNLRIEMRRNNANLITMEIEEEGLDSKDPNVQVEYTYESERVTTNVPLTLKKVLNACEELGCPSHGALFIVYDGWDRAYKKHRCRIRVT